LQENRPRIFISVAAYRDAETISTVNDLFMKATYPERLTVGVLSQIDFDSDEHFILPAMPRVKQMVIPAQDSLGACWARNKILTRLRSDEEFVFQIDSHSRFIKGWDEKLMHNWKLCSDPNAVITHYPVGYKPPYELDEQSYTWHNVKNFSPDGLPVITSGSKSLKEAPHLPRANALLAAGCLFGPKDAFDKVPYDPYLYFIGEEISMAVRLYTHGFNLYTPSEPFMWHQYYQPTTKRKRHWEDHKDWGSIDILAKRRIKHLLGIELTKDALALKEYSKYCLGRTRSLQNYEDFSGIHFREKRLDNHAKEGVFSQ
jgi:glycosyltransferase involved in cell wall biosynthesis